MTIQNEIPTYVPTVRVSGVEVSDLLCNRVTKRTGISPSTCDLQYVSGQDTIGPRTLTNGGSYKHKQRVVVYNRDIEHIWFQGWLTKRRDQHAQNTVFWTANDDTILLRQSYVKGCYISDILLDGTRALKYSQALDTIFNPKGSWNCIGKEITTTEPNGEGGVVEVTRTYPVFAPTALQGQAYATPNQQWDQAPSLTKIEPWTPRRILQYLQLVMHTYYINNEEDVIGEGFVQAKNSINPDYLSLSFEHIAGLDAIDPGYMTQDPLDRIAPQLQLQGDTLIGAFEKTLRIVGTHLLATSYDKAKFSHVGGLKGVGKTNLIFQPQGYMADGKSIQVQFDGLVDREKGTIFDFSLSEDSLDSSPDVFVEGESEKLEIQLEYTGDPETSTIVPAWTQDEEDSFLRCILGNTDLTGNPGPTAIVPKISGKTSDEPGEYERLDGTGDRPYVSVLSPQAISFAQQNYPTVFRAFLVRTYGDLKDALGGDDAIIHPRPILPQQLQFLTWQAEKVGDTRLRTALPIRLSVQPNDGDKYYDAGRDIRIKVTTNTDGDNLIWLDGASTSVDDKHFCIYAPSLLNNFKDINNGINVRKFKLNCAMITDRRVQGQAYVANPFSEDFPQAFAGIPYAYVDDPKSFRNYRQVNSYPAANSKYYDGTDGITPVEAPLNRSLPPGDETEYSEYAAQRELAIRRRPVRNSSWKQFGLQRTIDAGDWLSTVKVEKEDGTTDYDVDSVVRTVVFDFMPPQTTTVGDVFGDIGSAQI